MRCGTETNEQRHPEFRPHFGGNDKQNGLDWESRQRESGCCESQDDHRNCERTASTDGSVFHHYAPLRRPTVDDKRVAEVDHTIDMIDTCDEVHGDDESERNRRWRSRNHQREYDERADNVSCERHTCWPVSERIPCGSVVADGKPRKES